MSIVGRVTERFYVPDNARKLAVAQGYKRDPGDPEWPFGREVILMEIRGGNVDEFDRETKTWNTVYREGTLGDNGIILGRRLNKENVIGIGALDTVYGFEIDPNAQEVPGHAKLLFDHCNDFAEFTGWQD